MAEDMFAVVRRAIADPGSVLPREDDKTVPAWSARAVLAVLAADPGNLPARMAWEIRNTECEHFGRDGGACSPCRAAAALSVRWEHAAHLAARVGDAERRAEHAENEHQVTQERLAEAERRLDQLRAYARWCNDRSVEPKERDIRELADGTHRDCVCATRLAEAENPDGGK